MPSREYRMLAQSIPGMSIRRKFLKPQGYPMITQVADPLLLPPVV